MKKIFMNILIKLFLILIGLLTIFADFMGVLVYDYFEEIKKNENEKRMERMRCSALICPVGLYIDDVLIYLFDDTHICISCLQNIPKFTIATKIIRLRNRILPFENVSKSPFFSFISLSGFRVCHLYMS